MLLTVYSYTLYLFIVLVKYNLSCKIILFSVSLIFDVSTVSEHELLLFEWQIVDREKTGEFLLYKLAIIETVCPPTNEIR